MQHPDRTGRKKDMMFLCAHETLLSTQGHQQYTQCPSILHPREIEIMWSQTVSHANEKC